MAKTDTVTVTCTNCGGTVREIDDAKGNIGACEDCGQAEVVTKTRGEEIDKALEAGEPIGGGTAPALTEEEIERVRAIAGPEEAGGAPAPVGPDVTPTAENAPEAEAGGEPVEE